MTNYNYLLKVFSVLAFAATLVACEGGGVGTSSNPNLGNTAGGTTYTGSAARDVNVSNFQYYLYNNLNPSTRCGGCHNSEASSPVSPLFFDTSDVNVAYDASIGKIDLVDPFNSGFVSKLNSGHFCWEPISSICGTMIAGWIADWKNGNNGGTAERLINLVAPDNIRDPGDAKSFPVSATEVGINGTSFANTVYPLLVGTNPVIANDNCQNCHEEIASPLPQAPFFASGDIDSAFEAAKAKMDIDNPSNSRFVLRMNELHNCWSDCVFDAALMEARIASFAAGIAATPIDPLLVTSKAMTMREGIVAVSGGRNETSQFAIWEFKTGTGLTAFDTSGIDPAVNLSLIGSVNWVGGYGLEFTGGRAQADTINSDKLFSYIQDTGEYSIEAWVIPSNVTQQDTNIISYSGGDTSRNFTLGQTLYNYEAFNRIDSIPPAPNGDPFLTTGQNGEEIAQASQQHVVVNYNPFDLVNPGRSIYVNGQLVNVTDPVAGPTTISNVWDDTFAMILGNEISGQRPWMGQIKMLAMHNRALTPVQIAQNFEVDPSEKFMMLFYVGHHLGEDPANPLSFILFEVSQFDNYSYLFNKPTFVNLDPAFVPGSIQIKGMRIGINGKESFAGQAYANLDATVDVANGYNSTTGQELSSLGTVVALEKGSNSDVFFLSFEDFNGSTKAFPDILATVPADPVDPVAALESDIGVRTFAEINATMASTTGIPVTNTAVESVYQEYLQQLPAVETIDAFLPSHQMAVAQLAMAYCNALVDNNPDFFPGFDFAETAMTAFGPLAPGLPDATHLANRQLIIDPLTTAVLNVDQATPGNNLTSQPDQVEIDGLLGGETAQILEAGLDPYDSLITKLINTAPDDSILRTAQIAKAVCASAIGGGVMLVQ